MLTPLAWASSSALSIFSSSSSSSSLFLLLPPFSVSWRILRLTLFLVTAAFSPPPPPPLLFLPLPGDTSSCPSSPSPCGRDISLFLSLSLLFLTHLPVQNSTVSHVFFLSLTHIFLPSAFRPSTPFPGFLLQSFLSPSSCFSRCPCALWLGLGRRSTSFTSTLLPSVCVCVPRVQTNYCVLIEHKRARS